MNRAPISGSVRNSVRPACTRQMSPGASCRPISCSRKSLNGRTCLALSDGKEDEAVVYSSEVWHLLHPIDVNSACPSSAVPVGTVDGGGARKRTKAFTVSSTSLASSGSNVMSTLPESWLAAGTTQLPTWFSCMKGVEP